MQYSPKLKAAIEKIKAIIKENDIAGYVVLHEPGFSEYIFELSPSYSAAVTDPDGQLRVRIKTAEIGAAKAKQKATDTVNMFHCLARCVGPAAMHFIDMDKMLTEKYTPDHFGPGHSSHNQQNN